jgi:hypothetical protein
LAPVLWALPSPAATQVAASLVEVEVLPITGPVARLDVRLDRPTDVLVQYGASEGPWLTAVSSEKSVRRTLPLTRLLPDTDYVFRVIAGGDSATGRFRSASLPEDLRRVSIRTSGRSTAPLTLLELSNPSGFSGPVIVDRDGNVVWYFRTEGDIHGVVQRAGGSFVFLDTGHGLLEVSSAGEILARLEDSAERTIHHDVEETRAGLLLFLAREWQVLDGDSIHGETVWSWDPSTGRTERRWSAFEHFDPRRDRGVRSADRNWLHGNSLSEGPRGNLVVGLSFLDQVVSIAPDFGAIEWRMGGPGATHSVRGEPFSGQHAASEVAPGRVLLFDNGFSRGEAPGFVGAYSRAVEYEMRGGEAHPVWAFRSPGSTWSRVVGSAERLANGNTLVAFGAAEGLRSSRGPIEVFEVDAREDVVWRLTLEGPVRTLYRATALQTIGGERPGER